MQNKIDALIARGCGEDTAICPQCGGEVKIKWEGHWVSKLNARCIGKWAGCRRESEPCGFELLGLGRDDSRLARWQREQRKPESHRGGLSGGYAMGEALKESCDEDGLQ